MLAFVALALATAPLACEATWRDTARRRDLPVRITLPAGAARVPLVVWSPGLGGDQRSGSVWVRAWAGAGFAVVQMAHPGSDAAVYRPGGTPEERRARVQAAITPQQLEARVGDVRFALSEFNRRPAEGACDLRRIDTGRAAIAGHSMGAWVAQGVAGQRFMTSAGVDKPLLRDTRFRAAIALSPTATPGTTAFRRVAIPMLFVTGTLDGTSAAAPPAERAAALAARTAAFESMPADGRSCLLVFADAQHMMFAGNRIATDATTEKLVSNVVALTLKFLESALSDTNGAIVPPTGAVLAPGDSLRCR